MSLQIRKLTLLALGLAAASAHAGLADTITDSTPTSLSGSIDGILDANEYGAGNAQLVMGGGAGFGGTVGNGSLYMDVDGGNLKIGFQPGGTLDNVLVLYLDTKAGGFTDATMSDTGDTGRNSITNPRRGDGANPVDGLVTFDATFLPDYALAIDSNGIGVFELTSGSLNYITGDFSSLFNTGSDADFREISLAKTALSINSAFNFVGIYTSGTGFLSNESIPGGIAGGNPGFGPGTTNVPNFDRFETVPEPASMLALGLGAAALLRRRRK